MWLRQPSGWAVAVPAARSNAVPANKVMPPRKLRREESIRTLWKCRSMCRRRLDAAARQLYHASGDKSPTETWRGRVREAHAAGFAELQRLADRAIGAVETQTPAEA